MIPIANKESSASLQFRWEPSIPVSLKERLFQRLLVFTDVRVLQKPFGPCSLLVFSNWVYRNPIALGFRWRVRIAHDHSGPAIDEALLSVRKSSRKRKPHRSTKRSESTAVGSLTYRWCFGLADCWSRRRCYRSNKECTFIIPEGVHKILLPKVRQRLGQAQKSVRQPVVSTFEQGVSQVRNIDTLSAARSLKLLDCREQDGKETAVRCPTEDLLRVKGPFSILFLKGANLLLAGARRFSLPYDSRFYREKRSALAPFENPENRHRPLFHHKGTLPFTSPLGEAAADRQLELVSTAERVGVKDFRRTRPGDPSLSPPARRQGTPPDRHLAPAPRNRRG